jgi:hypothetical protein
MYNDRKYYVWRRDDGYVSSTTYPPKDYPIYDPATGKSSEIWIRFEILGEFAEWEDARERIRFERLPFEVRTVCLRLGRKHGTR